MKKNILLIEDDKFISKSIIYAFNTHHLDVKASRTVEQAMEMLQHFKPDIILLDLLLPGKDGFYFLRESKKNPLLKDVPIIVTSNLPEDPNIEPGEETVYTKYIVKSDLDLEDLIKTTLSYLH